MKKSIKTAIIICTAAICLVAAITSILLGIKHHQKKVYYNNSINLGFYNISEAQKEAFTQILMDICDQKSFPVNFYSLDPNQDFDSQIKDKKLNLILAPAGYAVNKIVSSTPEDVQIPAAVTTGFFSTMRQTVIENNGKLKAVPLIFDNMEIDFETSAFKMSRLEQIASWEELEKFAELQKRDMDYPVCFAGAEPAFLIDLLGALGEALEGYEAYKKAAQILEEAVQAKKTDIPFDAAATANKIFMDPDAPLPYSMYYLKQLIKKGYVLPSSKELVHKDINSYIKQRITRTFFTTLSVHRTYETKDVSRFTSVFIPSSSKSTQRHFTAPATYAVPLTVNKNVGEVIEQLVSESVQEKLSQLTGLAPVHSKCRTPDRQADDARYWIAATNPPVAGLSREAELTDADLANLAKEIKALLFY